MSNILKDLIIEKFGTVAELARVVNLPHSTVKTITERGATNSNALNVKKICDALNIDMYALLCGQIKEFVTSDFKLTLKEKQLIETYRTLDDYGVDVVDSVLELEKERNIHYANKIEYIWLPYTYTRASAGLGAEIVDDGEFVKIPRTSEAEQASYVVKIAGDSMSPLYEDGDCVLIQSTQDLMIGDIGLFVLNNEAFIKKMGVNSLISQNPVYEPILIKESDECLKFGKVLGKTEVLE